MNGFKVSVVYGMHVLIGHSDRVSGTALSIRQVELRAEEPTRYYSIGH